MKYYHEDPNEKEPRHREQDKNEETVDLNGLFDMASHLLKDQQSTQQDIKKSPIEQEPQASEDTEIDDPHDTILSQENEPFDLTNLFSMFDDIVSNPNFIEDLTHSKNNQALLNLNLDESPAYDTNNFDLSTIDNDSEIDIGELFNTVKGLINPTMLISGLSSMQDQQPSNHDDIKMLAEQLNQISIQLGQLTNEVQLIKDHLM